MVELPSTGLPRDGRDPVTTVFNEKVNKLLRKLSTARCARVSYLTHDGVRDLKADFDMHDRLSSNGHWSPFEHVAMALPEATPSGNFTGWRQYRKTFANEHIGGVRP
jgi:hypothetical protein